jgi:uncharacterized protein YndB with AHSA1/START domain
MTRLPALLLLLTLPAAAQEIRFRKKIINNERYESVGAFDVNGDGRPDLISGAWWYESPDFARRQHVGEVRAEGEYYDDFSTIPLDVNGDGRTDFVTGGWWGNTLRWRENPGRPADGGYLYADWPEHVIAQTGNVETTRAWDVDGDGTVELVPNNPGHPFKFYRLNRDAAGKPTGTFTEHRIADNQGHGLGFGDVNGDGRGDFVLSDGWLEAPKNPFTEKWSWHPDFKLGSASIPIIVTDLNGDRRTDLIVGHAHGYGLRWVEQTAGGWVKHAIDSTNSQFHEMIWTDLDGDQKPELITGKRYRAHNGNDPGATDDYGLYYYRWNGRGFSKHTIAFGPKTVGKGTGIHFVVTDLNADRRPDIAVAGKDGLWVFFNEGLVK